MRMTFQMLRNIAIAGAAAILFTSCSQESDNTETPASAAGAPGFNLTLDMTEFMAHVVEPTADVIWKSAGWVSDENDGYYELYPTDDAGWENVHNHGAMMVEAGNLMMLPGRAMDGAWMTYSEAISTVGSSIMSAADAQNKEDLFQAGAQLYSVCTACHQAYNPEILSRFTPESLTQ